MVFQPLPVVASVGQSHLLALLGPLAGVAPDGNRAGHPVATIPSRSDPLLQLLEHTFGFTLLPHLAAGGASAPLAGLVLEFHMDGLATYKKATHGLSLPLLTLLLEVDQDAVGSGSCFPFLVRMVLL